MNQVKYKPQDNRSGDASAARQGFGRVSDSAPPQFDPEAELDQACSYFEANGFVALRRCLNPSEIAELNAFYNRTQQEVPEKWGFDARKPHHREQGLILSQPLLDYPELDDYICHAASYGVVCRLLGGEEHVRFAEFNLREAPSDAGPGSMNFHHDRVIEDRLEREPYHPVDYLCRIHYLTDTQPGTPAFCVVPASNRFETLREAFEEQGDAYREVPIYGPAGTCIIYDSALFHTRLDGDGYQPRRTWHQYFARGGWLRSTLPTTNRYVRAPSPALTDWNLFPERLVFHEDPKIRRLFSHWNTAQGEWVASSFSDEVRDAMPRGNQ